MAQFKKHYTLEEARALLPKIREWFAHLDQCQETMAQVEKRLSSLSSEGHDLGGETVDRWAKTLADMRTILHEFQSREIQVKDMERGLIDFPALREGREVFLCWEKDEEDIENWHDIDTGYSGREPL
ncbi:MAG: hypothetical protein JWM68_4833 [Verrucomicrobiales bacterium]|nr:hypothetical protein [Verrucomicrobiales bacterium]